MLLYIRLCLPLEDYRYFCNHRRKDKNQSSPRLSMVSIGQNSDCLNCSPMSTHYVNTVDATQHHIHMFWSCPTLDHYQTSIFDTMSLFLGGPVSPVPLDWAVWCFCILYSPGKADDWRMTNHPHLHTGSRMISTLSDLRKLDVLWKDRKTITTFRDPYWTMSRFTLHSL